MPGSLSYMVKSRGDLIASAFFYLLNFHQHFISYRRQPFHKLLASIFADTDHSTIDRHRIKSINTDYIAKIYNITGMATKETAAIQLGLHLFHGNIQLIGADDRVNHGLIAGTFDIKNAVDG